MPKNSGDGPSFDSIFDPNIPFDDEDIAMLSMEIAMYVREYIKANPGAAKILSSKSSDEKQKNEIKEDLKNYVISQFKDYLKILSKSIEKPKIGDGQGSPINIDVFLGIFNKSLEEGIKIVESVGSQEGAKGIGWWGVGKTIKSSFKYYGERVRGSSKTKALKKQLIDWEVDYRTENSVRDGIRKEHADDPEAKKQRLSHWDRRIFFKRQKINEKRHALIHEQKTREKISQELDDEINESS